MGLQAAQLRDRPPVLYTIEASISWLQAALLLLAPTQSCPPICHARRDSAPMV